MAGTPNKPIDDYPVVAEGDKPVVPPVEPGASLAAAVPADAPADVRAPLPAERLTFRPGKKPLSETIELEYPFEWNGELVESITVRRLTVAEVADIADVDFERFGLWAIYAAQAGLPVGVLRGLVEDDGDRFTAVSRGFLPRAFAVTLTTLAAGETPSSPTPASGAPTSPA